MLEEEGLTRRQAAQAVGCTTRTVSRVLALHRDTGEVEAHHGGGRQTAYAPRRMRRLDVLIEQNPHATASGLRALMGPSAPPITDRTMRKYRRQLIYTRRRQGIQLYDTPAYVSRRKAWARQHRNDSILSWLFMDESTMVLRHTADLVWIKRGKDTPPHLITHLTPAVNMWGVVWDDGHVFVQYQGQINETVILDCLDGHLSPHLPDLPGRTIVADGASYQYTAAVRDWYVAAGLVPLKLPPKSPRFNAIERCWGWLKRHVRGQAPQTNAQLAAALAAACLAIPQAVIRSYIREARQHIRTYATQP
jgi:hypothetical protein